MAGFRHGGEQPLDQGARVHPYEILDRRFRRGAALQPGEFGRFERLQYRA
jgi:hypothetical protein